MERVSWGTKKDQQGKASTHFQLSGSIQQHGAARENVSNLAIQVRRFKVLLHSSLVRDSADSQNPPRDREQEQSSPQLNRVQALSARKNPVGMLSAAGLRTTASKTLWELVFLDLDASEATGDFRGLGPLVPRICVEGRGFVGFVGHWAQEL